jgi:DNA-binding response OmpR family regulator
MGLNMGNSDTSLGGSAVVDDDQEGPCRILLVEDELSTAEMLIAYFSSLGYQVSHTGWGRDALTLASRFLPDLVILDIHLPDIDGYEVCSQLRAQTRTENVPVIFLTERKERVDRLTGLELGAIDYITKPFDVQELRFRVRNALRRSGRETLLHRITGLPTSRLIEEELDRVADNADLSTVGITIKGMDAFSDAYGFVTHDDVLRAVALILRNTATESGRTDLFVGQLDLYQFLIVTRSGQDLYVMMGRLDQRLNEAASFFYPHRDWERGTRPDGTGIPRMKFEIQLVTASMLAQTNGLAELRQALSLPPA